MRNILVTNDDGIESQGLLRLVRAATAFGRVWVVAPDSQRSAASHSITLHQMIDVWPREYPVPGVSAYAISGTPADCVRMGGLRLMPVRPDAVLSGINAGYNAATDIQYSATCGAAFEAAFQGYQAIALSEGTGGCNEVTDAYLNGILEELIDKDPGEDRIWNVNFPDCTLDECAGILRGRTVSRSSFYRDQYNLVECLRDGGARYLAEGIAHGRGEESTDLYAILHRFVSVGTVKNVG